MVAVLACRMAVSVTLQDVDPDEWQLVEAGRNRSPAERLRELEQYSAFVTAGRAALRRAGTAGVADHAWKIEEIVGCRARSPSPPI